MKHTGVPQIAPNVMSFPSGEDTALHNLDTDQYALLVGPVASWIWSHIDSVDSITTIGESICRRFEIDERQVLTDLDELLDHLVNNGFVLITPSNTETGKEDSHERRDETDLY